MLWCPESFRLKSRRTLTLIPRTINTPQCVFTYFKSGNNMDQVAVWCIPLDNLWWWQGTHQIPLQLCIAHARFANHIPIPTTGHRFIIKQ
jgi:hypothetical protein